MEFFRNHQEHFGHLTLLGAHQELFLEKTGNSQEPFENTWEQFRITFMNSKELLGTPSIKKSVTLGSNKKPNKKIRLLKYNIKPLQTMFLKSVTKTNFFTNVTLFFLKASLNSCIDLILSRSRGNILFWWTIKIETLSTLFFF